ncbi:MAG: gamma-glutamyl-gamma-aminobutyrate hydrolase family protein [Candidatus Electryoneaceae bacterium]|nr:gamma-glutamyl-gamma-aminobutyrate hydrolase family protein [Candidatus Electryoneaceae bacterium]
MKPVIGISANISHPNDPNRTFSKGTALHLIQHHYIQFVEIGGGVPVLLPVLRNIDDDCSSRGGGNPIDSDCHSREGGNPDVSAMVSHLDGIIITGGPDLDPLFYGQTNSKNHSMGIDPNRDIFEIALAKEAMRQDRALLGICRGIQILNVALGGDLYQDTPTMIDDANPHMFLKDSRERYHEITLTCDSFLTKLFGDDEKIVNSSHHQSLKKLGDGLSLVAVSDHGIVEAVQRFDDRCTVGVQWHPERMLGNYPAGWSNNARDPQIRLAEWFVSQSACDSR